MVSLITSFRMLGTCSVSLITYLSTVGTFSASKQRLMVSNVGSHTQKVAWGWIPPHAPKEFQFRISRPPTRAQSGRKVPDQKYPQVQHGFHSVCPSENGSATGTGGPRGADNLRRLQTQSRLTQGFSLRLCGGKTRPAVDNWTFGALSADAFSAIVDGFM